MLQEEVELVGAAGALVEDFVAELVEGFAGAAEFASEMAKWGMKYFWIWR